jgi:hypothetical protein
MSSPKKIQANRRNGARSKGPKTPEGKRRSRYNAVRHGLLADCTVLENESMDGFQELLQHHVRRFAPIDDIEFGFVEEMASAYWRLRRAFAIEKDIFEKAIENQTGPDELTRVGQAWREIADSPSLQNLYRYQSMLHRMHQRALNNLLLLRSVEPLESDLRNEPNLAEPSSPQEQTDETADIQDAASPAEPQVQTPSATPRPNPPDSRMLFDPDKFTAMDLLRSEIPGDKFPPRVSETSPDPRLPGER